MASTFSNIGIELIPSGFQSGTWGNTTNVNLQIIDRLTTGVGAITLSGTTHTLTTVVSGSATLSDGQYAVLVFGGSPSGTNTVTIAPNTSQHIYLVKNNSGQSVVLTQGSGGNVTIPNGKSAIVYCDGAGPSAAVVDLTNTFNFQPLDAELTAIAGLATTDGNIIVGNGSTWVAESGATARTSLGLTIGTNVQAYDAGLQSISGLTTSANQMIYTTGSDTYATTSLTAAGRAILDDADAAAQRTTLGLTIGTNVQAWDANLDQIAALTPTDGNFIVGNGSAWIVESGATVLASLGITASAAELNYNDITTLGTSQASKVVTANASGDVTLSEELTAKSYNETYATASSSAGALTINCETGNVFQVTLTEDVTSTSFANPPASGTAYGFTLRVVQDSTARAITWPAAVKWRSGGFAPALSQASGAIDVFMFFTTDAGANWYGFTAGQDFS